jgi:hypothetical protein
MRTITTIEDLYWAFAEMHSANSIIIGGERNEYTLEDGHVVYVTEEEKRFLDAIKKFECVEAPEQPSGFDIPPTSSIPDDMPAYSATLRKEEPIPATLFGCWRVLTKYWLMGNMRKHVPDTLKPAVEKIDSAIDTAVDKARKDCREIMHSLNRHQLEVALESTKEYVWESLGENFRKALANAAKKLVCATRTDACDKFLKQFMRGHARVGLKKYGRAVIYTEESAFTQQGESPEFPERDELLNLDFKYGEEFGQQDALALQMHMLNMYRLMPVESATCYGPDAGEIAPVAKAIANKTVSNDEMAWLYCRHFTLLNDAINKGVERVMGFVKDGPFLGRIKDPRYRESAVVEVATQVSNRVRMEIATLEGDDFAHILKDLDTMRSRESYNPFHRYPGAIIMKRIRLAMHEEIWRIRAREKYSI